LVSIVANLPLIPYLHSSEDIIFVGFVFLRTLGLFLVAPLLDSRSIPGSTRVMLTVFTAILLNITFYPDYRGPSPKYSLLHSSTIVPLEILLICIKELATGYMIGICFKMMYEAISVGGELITNVMGLSYSSMFDPISGQTYTTITHILLFITSMVLLFFDFHLQFFVLLKNSFDIVPIGRYQLTLEMTQDIIKGSSLLFSYGVQVGAFCVAVLLLVNVVFGFMSKVMPEMNVFVIAFPIRILIGMYALLLSIGYLPNIVQRCFIEYSNLVTALFFHMKPQ
jgi:flagellar biosynthetic protein FliR